MVLRRISSVYWTPETTQKIPKHILTKVFKGVLHPHRYPKVDKQHSLDPCFFLLRSGFLWLSYCSRYLHADLFLLALAVTETSLNVAYAAHAALPADAQRKGRFFRGFVGFFGALRHVPEGVCWRLSTFHHSMFGRNLVLLFSLLFPFQIWTLALFPTTFFKWNWRLQEIHL